MYQFPYLHPGHQMSQVDVYAPDLDRFPAFGDAEFLEVTVRPGEVLFVPPLWGHHVTSLSRSTSISIWSHCPETRRVQNTFRETPLPFPADLSPPVLALAMRLHLGAMVGQILPGGEAGTNAFYTRLFESRFQSCDFLAQAAAEHKV